MSLLTLLTAGEPTLVTSLIDHQPEARHDEVAFTRARIDWAENFDGPWLEVDTITLEEETAATTVNVWWGGPVNRPLEPELPPPRSFTIGHGAAAQWFRVAWLDDNGFTMYGPTVAAGEFPFLPTPAGVATELRGRTRDASGNLIGVFTSNTSADDDLVNNVIAAAARDVENAAGRRIPGPLIERARRAAALRAAQIAERSMLPEQSGDDRSSYSALRVDAEEAMDNLKKRMRAWRLAYRQAAI